MTRCPRTHSFVDNNFVFSYRCTCHGVRMQRKRVRQDMVVWRDIYFHKGIVGIVVELRNEGLSVKEAYVKAKELVG